MKFTHLETEDHGVLGVSLHQLEERLRDPQLDAGLVRTTRLTPETTTEASS